MRTLRNGMKKFFQSFTDSDASKRLWTTYKDDKNKLRIAPKSLITSVFFYAIAGNALVQFVVNLVKVIAFKNYEFSTLSVYLIEFGVMIGITVVVTIAFALSLARTKRFINACLIKIDNR